VSMDQLAVRFSLRGGKLVGQRSLTAQDSLYSSKSCSLREV
jgi:hypothetical protein